MPMSRYEIRNEYSLADPELYRAADKDDPEALLEGVAMAGLIGVLRQLGDLAEFAAEIFHDLHEEVMVTAARGHSLMMRVEQLESEVPYIEKTFLSQTDHSAFFYSTGIEWHPSTRMGQNLVAQGDLPRFIMDSYEECRGPPRLFLLDKFDVAGAGACLKRYTDPSFFKVEISEMTSANVQREKKIRRAKKKGPRWRNGATPEVLQPSHAKLHQLFQEECVENGVGNHVRRVKLKRRLNGFPFDTKSGKSYMEKLLKTPTPEHEMVDEVDVSSSLQMLPTDDNNASSLGVLEVRPVSPDRASVRRKIISPSPSREEIMLNPSMYESNEVSGDDRICEGANSYPSLVADEYLSSLDMVNGENDIAADGETTKQNRVTGYESDDIASEIDNYVDASSGMESEMDTDSELRVDSDVTSSVIKTQSLISDGNEDDLRTLSADAQSPGESTMSDERNNSSKKEIAWFSSSRSPSTSAENPHSEVMLPEGSPSADTPEIDLVDGSSYQTTADNFAVDQNHMVSEYICTSTDALTNNKSDSGESTMSDERNSSSKKEIPWFSSTRSPNTSAENPDTEIVLPEGSPSADAPEIDLVDGSSYQNTNANFAGDPNQVVSEYTCNKTDALITNKSDSEQLPIISYSDSEGVTKKDRKRGLELDTTVSGSDDKVKEINLVKSAPCATSFSHSAPQSGDDSPRFSAEEHAVDEQKDLLHEDGFDHKDLNLVRNTRGTLLPNTNYNTEMVPNENTIPGKLDVGFPKLPECFFPDCTDIAQNGDSITSTVSKEEKISDELDNEESSASADVSNRFSDVMEASHGKELIETSLADAYDVEAVEHYCESPTDDQINSGNISLPHVENSLDLPGAVLDAHDVDVSTIEETTLNETPALGTPESCEVLGSQDREATCDIPPIDSATLEKSCCIPNNTEEPAETLHNLEVSGITPPTNTIGVEVTETLGSVDVELVKESDCGTEQSKTADSDSAGHSVSDIANRNNFSLHVGHDKLVEEHTCANDSDLNELEDDSNYLSGRHRDILVEEHTSCSEDSDLDELEDDKNCLSGSHRKSSLGDDVGNREVTASDSGRVFCENTNDDHLKAEVSDKVHNSYLGLDVQHSSDFGNATMIQSPLEECGLQETIKQSAVRAHVSDAPPMPINSDIEETTFQEKVELQSNQLHGALLDSGEVSSELSFLLPSNTSQIMDHNDKEGNNKLPCMFSPVKSSSPPSSPELPRLANDDVNVSAYPKDPSGSIFPPIDISSDANQINLGAVPPLPPLPPVQWMMGKFQHDSSITEGEIMQHELFPQLISLPVASANAVSFSIEETNHSLVHIAPETTQKEDKVDHSLSNLDPADIYATTNLQLESINEQQKPTASTSAVNSSIEEMNPSLVQIAPESASKEEKFEHILSNLEANDMDDEPMDLQLERAHDTRNPIASTDAVSVTLEEMNHSPVQLNRDAPAKSETVENKSCSLEVYSKNETADFPPDVEKDQQQPYTCNEDVSSSLEEANHLMIQIDPETTSKQEKVQEDSSSSEDNPIDTIDPPRKIENEPRKLIEEMNHSPVQLNLDAPAKSETVENKSCSLEVYSKNETADFPPEVEKDQQQPYTCNEDVSSSLEEANHSMIHIDPETTSKQEKVPEDSSSLEANIIDTIDPPRKIENEPRKLILPLPGSEFASAEDDNRNRTVKLPRPRNPLISDVSALDKSKLKKATERVLPQIQKVDERDSLLEQIRTKSFNLKPAMTSRPSIRDPRTNLKLAAILEKANAIRQAFADSDEDEDGWSDS